MSKYLNILSVLETMPFFTYYITSLGNQNRKIELHITSY